MNVSWTRRDLLRTVAAAAAAPVVAGLASPRRTVGIVGAGMAGVSLAWLLDGERDVVVLEAGDAIGGHVRSVDIDLDGHQFVVDMGAQYFHPGPYPLYTALLAHLSLYPPDSTEPQQSHSFPASFTLADSSEPTPRFVSPILPDRAWPLLAPWNLAGVGAFAIAFGAARTRERRHESWALTLDEWLPTLGLSQAQWEGMILPWVASISSGDIERTRGESARASMIFAAKALPANPLDPVLYYVLNQGMVEALRRMLAQCSTVQVETSAVVHHVAREARGQYRVRSVDGRSFIVDDLVFAASGPGSVQLLNGLPGASRQRASLEGIEFFDARLALHSDPIYASPNPAFWSFLNSRVQGGYCEASMRLATVVAGLPSATAGKLWKSWVTHRDEPPRRILYETEFKHMRPTPSTISAQNTLAFLQGRDGLWFAGGYLHPYDSQETALRSAVGVALGLAARSARIDALRTLAVGEGIY